MKKTFWVPITLALAAFVALPLPGQSAPLSQRIAKKRSEANKLEKKAGVLTSTIAGYNTRIRRLQGEIGGTQRQLGRVQRGLDEARNELLETRDKLEVARDRLDRVRRELATGRTVLAERLVEIYKADQPDALTVVLEADGFADLLERTEFLDRISRQDRDVVDRVRRLRDKAKDQADELARLERQEQLVAERILRRRDEIAHARDKLVASRSSLASVRNDRRGALASVRRQHAHTMKDLDALEREQARVTGTLQNIAPGPIKHGSGRLIWPVSGTFTSPFGQRWGRLHAGIDISAPTGTPIRAADGGRVVIAAFTGGYGNYTCIQHTGSMSTCYGHQSSFATSSGAQVRQGQVIGAVGNTGNSTGPHLHFEVRIGGSPVDPMGYL